MSEKQFIKKLDEPMVNSETGLIIHGYFWNPSFTAFGIDKDGKLFEEKIFTTATGEDFFYFCEEPQFINNFTRLENNS